MGGINCYVRRNRRLQQVIDTIHFRQLELGDRDKLEQMETGIQDDYVIRIFDRLIEHKEHMIYGLFAGDQLVSVGGYTIFAEQYAMLGRLRTDIRYRGEGSATKLLKHVLQEIKKLDGINWVGGNTQRHNYSGMNVLNKLGLPELIDLHASTVVDVEKLDTETGPLWNEISNVDEKMSWLETLTQDPNTIFPYEAYYPFPVSPTLFKKENVKNWLLFKNTTEDRFLIVKEDQKKYKYAQTIYLWDDLWEQPGLLKTISHAKHQLAQQTAEDMYIRFDLTEKQRAMVPDEDAFNFQDPWVLHGKWLTR
ncbi:GNAT family N-acetyltransferase [Allobacillus salarius]|uniref:GNAT family N-acetyltransferase n=1 Tax=Allobacillus salarius TaxID=1955272 RepID=A0A556PQQ9_9BACI|nr:GNAT family N-acetyltransferase [Allobacillus salarius]